MINPLNSICTTWMVYCTLIGKVSVQGVVALGGHFATLSQELDFYEANFFTINFQKEKANTFTLLIILTVKSLQIELYTI